METLIIYSSKYGTTKRIVDDISRKLKGSVKKVNLRKEFAPDISNYDRVIIGGSVYAGSLNRKLKSFMNKNIDLLSKKKLGLFMVCMFEGDLAKKQFNENFDNSLRERAVVKGIFGGEVIVSKLNIIDRLIVWGVEKIKSDLSSINKKEIDNFVKVFNKR